MRPAVDRFTIRWDKSWGGYRVSCPEISTDGQPVEVVWAPTHDALLEVVREMAATMRDVLAIVDNLPDYPWQGGALKQQMREDITAYELLGLDVALASRDSQRTEGDPS